MKYPEGPTGVEFSMSGKQQVGCISFGPTQHLAGRSPFDDMPYVDRRPPAQQRYRDALQRIIDRSNTGEPGTSKVLDMRKIAEEALRG